MHPTDVLDFPKLYHVCFDNNFRHVSIHNRLLKEVSNFVLVERD